MLLPTAFVATILAVSAPARGTIAVAPGEGQAPAIFADTLEYALAEAGFTLLPAIDHARHVATVQVTRTMRGAMRTKGPRRKATVGGGTVFGNGAGMGVAVPFGSSVTIGQLIGTELTVRITPQGKATPAWEGRAITYQVAGSRGDDPAVLAKKLSAAILRNYDGPSGVLVSVP